MPDSRRIAALRALADRPGTPAEGEVARRKLEEALAKEPKESYGRPGSFSFDVHAVNFEFSAATMQAAFEKLVADLERGRVVHYTSGNPPAEGYRCPCASSRWRGYSASACPDGVSHEAINKIARDTYPPGSRAFLNIVSDFYGHWVNEPVTVLEYGKTEWNCVILRFCGPTWFKDAVMPIIWNNQKFTLSKERVEAPKYNPRSKF